MKFLTYLIFSLLFLCSACKTDVMEINSTCAEGVHLNDLVPLPDGTALRVIEVNDNYCPCGVICIWAGNLEVIVQAEGANRGPDTLGWQTGVATYGNYTISLGEVYNKPECGGRLNPEDFCFEVRVE
ncbi:hypothetical protein FUA23_07945 [Neolewinella aurantiaca]|uniref:Lipoprotein n=1 Tax=Neolewinella aurantiaca TaxID=2602767 RepID=A0A5C7FJV4_9BACT|nr:hypothetical protein [Neolewinella aurantiaca]TXF90158.1 hypothetical protein FUA23_07945 [Neolewinella aurantiaca]